MLLTSSSLRADGLGKLIFEDNFDRSESQESKEEIGNGWSSNSQSRAGGNKQVDLHEGTLRITMHPSADHAVSLKHDAEFRNGSVKLRFMLEHSQDVLGLDFADLQLKTVHAGHLFKVSVGTKKIDIIDMKTGVMDLKIRAQRQAQQVSAELQNLLDTKKKSFPVNLETGRWYSLNINIQGDTLQVTIDEKQQGEFSSAGIGHPTKRALRIAVPRQAVIDDLKIYSTAN